MAAVHASYFTDPACSGSWALEPAVRRLQREFGAEVRLSYVMVGLAREFGPPQGLVAQWLDAAAASGMPFDPRLWLEAPPRSSHPACLAVKAAAEQGDPAPCLRRLREGLMCGRRRLDHFEALLEEGRHVPGLDLERFRVDLGSHATLEALGADVERARRAGAQSPAIEFSDAAGATRLVTAGEPYEALRDAALASGATPVADAPPSVEEALRRFGTLATAEVAAVCELPGPRAAAELWRLAVEWRVRADRRLTGELWSLA